MTMLNIPDSNSGTVNYKGRSMNRVIYILVCLCIMVASCEKPGFEDVTQKGRTVIECDIESLLFEDSERVWPQGAMIGVFGSEKGKNTPFHLRNADSNLTRGEFYGQEVSGSQIAAYYPYGPAYTSTPDGFPVSLSPMQEYAPDEPLNVFLKHCPKAFAFMTNESLRFEYPFGMLCFRVELEETVTVNKVVVRAQQALAGSGKVSSGGLSLDAGAPESSVLDCKNTLSRDEQGNVVDFYMVVVPGLYQRLEVEFYVDGETTPLYCIVNGADIPRVGAENFSLLSVIVKGRGPEGFVSEKVEFDEEEE